MKNLILMLALTSCSPPLWRGTVAVEIDTSDEGRRGAVARAVATYAAVMRPHGVFLILGRPGQIRVHWGGDVRREAAGSTNVRWGDGDGHRADVEFRDDLTWSAEEECDSGFDVEGAAAHELGHALGLGHDDDVKATMFKTLFLCDTEKRSLASSDLQAIEELYGE